MSFATPGVVPEVVTVAETVCGPLIDTPLDGLVIQIVTVYVAETGPLVLQLFPAARVVVGKQSTTKLISITKIVKI